MEKLEALLDWGGTRKDVACLVLGGAALLLFALPCGVGGFGGRHCVLIFSTQSG